MIKEIQEIRTKALNLTLGDFVDYLSSLARRSRLEVVQETLSDILGDYRLMKQYYNQGVDDKMRDQLYDKLFKRTWVVSSQLLHAALLDENNTYKQAYAQAMHLSDFSQVQNLLVGVEQDITMASLDGEAAAVRIRELLDLQYKYRQQAFCMVYASGPLGAGEADTLRDCILSDEVSSYDKQILCSGLFLAQHSVFDLEKFRILCDIVIQSKDVQVKEKALVAVMLNLPGQQEERLFEEELDASFSLMMALPGMEKELAELQVQLLATLDTQQTNKHMKDNIIPLLMKSRFANPMIKSTEEDKLDDILHPEKEDEELERMEGYAREVRRLMKNGKDIFYGGFAQTKRYPMFYTLVNWFMPFYIEHPALRGNNRIPEKFVSQMSHTHGFCDSDMYSFALVFSQTYGMLPEDLRKLIESGEAVPDIDGFDPKDPANVRKLYLQQLYRFFNLWTEKDCFSNPFKDVDSLFFMNDDMVVEVMHRSRYAFHIAKELKEHGYDRVLKTMLSEYANWLNPDWLLLASRNAEDLHDNITAMMMLTVAETIKPKDKSIKLRRIELQMNHGVMPPMDKTLNKMLEEAEEGDDVEKMKWLLARTYMLKGKAEMQKEDLNLDLDIDNDTDSLAEENTEPEESYLTKAEKLLVELIQTNQDEINYVVELLNCCLMERRLEAIPNILAQVDADKLTSLCYLKQGLAQALLGKVRDAVDSWSKYCEMDKLSDPAAVRTSLRNALQSQTALLPEVEDAFNSIEIVIDLTAEKVKG